MLTKLVTSTLLISLGLGLTACGSNGSGSSSPQPQPSPQPTPYQNITISYGDLDYNEEGDAFSETTSYVSSGGINNGVQDLRYADIEVYGQRAVPVGVQFSDGTSYVTISVEGFSGHEEEFHFSDLNIISAQPSGGTVFHGRYAEYSRVEDTVSTGDATITISADGHFMHVDGPSLFADGSMDYEWLGGGHYGNYGSYAAGYAWTDGERVVGHYDDAGTYGVFGGER